MLLEYGERLNYNDYNMKVVLGRELMYCGRIGVAELIKRHCRTIMFLTFRRLSCYRQSAQLYLFYDTSVSSSGLDSVNRTMGAWRGLLVARKHSLRRARYLCTEVPA